MEDTSSTSAANNAADDFWRSLDELSYMTSETPQKNIILLRGLSEVNEVGRLHETSCETLDDYSYMPESKPGPATEDYRQPPRTGKGRAEVFHNMSLAYNSQAMKDHDIQAQLRQESPYNYSNEFIEMNFGVQPAASCVEVAAASCVEVAVQPTSGQFEDCVLDEPATNEVKVRSRNVVLNGLLNKDKSKTRVTGKSEKVDGSHGTEQNTQKYNDAVSRTNVPTGVEFTQAQIFLRSIKAINPVFDLTSSDFPPLQDEQNAKKGRRLKLQQSSSLSKS